MVTGDYTVFPNDLTEIDIWHKRLSHSSSKGLKILSKQGILPKGIND